VFDGLILSQAWKEALWGKFVTGALRARTPLELQCRDRLRAVECPMDMIDQIGGWKSVATIGVRKGI